MSNFYTLNYTPAYLTKGKSWTITFYAMHPLTGKMKRHRTKLNHIKNLKARKEYANRLIIDYNARLRQGWNPWTEKSAPKGFILFETALKQFITVKSKELAKDSIRSYRSYLKILTNWLDESGNKNLAVVNFTKRNALDFLEWVEPTIKTSSTFNNYRGFFRILFNWLIDKQYCIDNPFQEIKKRKKQPKQRIPIDAQTRTKIRNHLGKHDPDFLIVCMLVFHALIRPKEITMLRPCDFSLDSNVICIRNITSKNSKTRRATIPPQLMNYLKVWDFNGAKEEEFIFGKNFLPGEIAICPRRFSKRWDRLRTKINLPQEMKLYSLRDSGIIQMLQDGISPEMVRNQADHHSLEVTNRYLKEALPEASVQIMEKATGF